MRHKDNFYVIPKPDRFLKFKNLTVRHNHSMSLDHTGQGLSYEVFSVENLYAIAIKKTLLFLFCLILSKTSQASHPYHAIITEYDIGQWAYVQHESLTSNLNQILMDNYKPVLLNAGPRLPTETIFSLTRFGVIEIRDELLVLVDTSGKKGTKTEYQFRKTELYKLLKDEVKQYISYYQRHHRLVEDSIPLISRQIIDRLNQKTLKDLSDTNHTVYYSSDFASMMEKSRQLYLKSSYCEVQFVTFVANDPEDPTVGYDSILCYPNYPDDTVYLHGFMLALASDKLTQKISGLACCYNAYAFPLKEFKDPFPLAQASDASFNAMGFIRKEDVSHISKQDLDFLDFIVAYKIIQVLDERAKSDADMRNIYFKRFKIDEKR